MVGGWIRGDMSGGEGGLSAARQKVDPEVCGADGIRLFGDEVSPILEPGRCTGKGEGHEKPQGRENGRVDCPRQGELGVPFPSFSTETTAYFQKKQHDDEETDGKIRSGLDECGLNGVHRDLRLHAASWADCRMSTCLSVSYAALSAAGKLTAPSMFASWSLFLAASLSFPPSRLMRETRL